MEGEKAERRSINASIEKVLDSQWWIVAESVWILIFHCIGQDMLGFSGLIALLIVMCIFCSDFRPLLAPMVMGVLVVSTQNSPGYTNGQNYYYTTPVIISMLTQGTLLIGALIFNFTYYKKWKSLAIKSNVALSLALYCLVLILSAVFVATHKAENLVFALVTVASIMVVYILAKGVTKKRSDGLLFLARLCSAMAIIIAIEIAWVYVMRYDFSVPLDGSWIGKLIVGWGVQNIASEMIVMLMPALFYLAYFDHKRCLLYFSGIILCMVAIFFAFCRTSILFGTIVFVFLSLFCMFKGKGKVKIRYFMLVVTLVAVAVVLIVYFANNSAFKSVVNMWLTSEGKLDTNIDSRIELWKKALEYFRLKPILGNGFLTYFYEVGVAENSCYVYLFHNTFFQILGSAGLVGIASLAYSRISAALVFIKKPSVEKMFFGVALLICVLMGLLDIIMFVPYVLFFYSLILAFCEKDNEKK